MMVGWADCRRAFVLAAFASVPGLALADWKEADLIGQIAACWNVGALSTHAPAPVVTLKIELDRDGKPLAETFELIGAGKDTSDTVLAAYDAARRAVIRCGAQGFDLPLEKYDRWRNIELTFNPERMPSQ